MEAGEMPEDLMGGESEDGDSLDDDLE